MKLILDKRSLHNRRNRLIEKEWGNEKIIRFNGNTGKRDADRVVMEHRVKLLVNGAFIAELICSPADIKQLAWGHLITQGYINDFAQIKKTQIDDDLRKVHIKTDSQCSLIKPLKDAPFNRPIKKLRDTRIDPTLIHRLSHEFLISNEDFLKTGCVHSSALCYDGQLHHFCSDISRHNAMDKTIGYALYNSQHPEDLMLFTTGRIPLDMAKKAIQAQIPAIVSRGAVTREAILLARKHNLTLIGFSRGTRFNVYHLGGSILSEGAYLTWEQF